METSDFTPTYASFPVPSVDNRDDLKAVAFSPVSSITYQHCAICNKEIAPKTPAQHVEGTVDVLICNDCMDKLI